MTEAERKTSIYTLTEPRNGSRYNLRLPDNIIVPCVVEKWSNALCPNRLGHKNITCVYEGLLSAILLIGGARVEINDHQKLGTSEQFMVNGKTYLAHGRASRTNEHTPVPYETSLEFSITEA